MGFLIDFNSCWYRHSLNINVEAIYLGVGITIITRPITCSAMVYYKAPVTDRLGIINAFRVCHHNIHYT
jgi:hypothetical protein